MFIARIILIWSSQLTYHKDWGYKRDIMKDTVLVTLKGKSIITQEDLDQEKEYWSQDPQLQDSEDEEAGTGYLGSPAFEQNCLEFLIQRKIADEYIVANKIDETAEYQKQLSKAINNLHRELLNDTINVPVTEAEVRSSYEEWNSGRSFEEDREMIEKVLKKQKFRPYFDEKIEQLKQEYDVKINEDFLK